MTNKAVFLDRDNTLIEDPGYINHPDQVKLLDGVADALMELKAMGYKLVVTTNQSAVARGIITETVLGEIHERLIQLLAAKGATLDGIYYCPYHPEGIVPKYRIDSDMRKPKPGMLLAASKDLEIDLGQSWSVGDRSGDVEAGLKAGCKTILIDSGGHHKQFNAFGTKPDYRAVNIKEAVNIIKKQLRSTAKPAEPARPFSHPSKAADLKPAQDTEPVPAYQDQLPQPRPQHKDAVEETAFGDRHELLLHTISEQLKNIQRADMFGEFSMMRFLAGMLQVAVFFCLLIGIWLLTGTDRQDSLVLIALGFGAVLQLTALTFYTMHGRR